MPACPFNRSPHSPHPLKIRRFIQGALFALLLISSQQAWAWQLEIEEPNIQVWTKQLSTSEFKAFRGKVLIKAPIATVMDFIKDTPNMINWYHNTIVAKRLKKLAPHTWLSYSVTQAPWPVTDRDSVTIVSEEPVPNGYRLTMQAAPEQYPLQENRIRIPKLDGYWLIEEIAANITQVTLEISAEPGGEIPSWLANSLVIDMPYYSLSNLKEQIENRP